MDELLPEEMDLDQLALGRVVKYTPDPIQMLTGDVPPIPMPPLSSNTPASAPAPALKWDANPFALGVPVSAGPPAVMPPGLAIGSVTTGRRQARSAALLANIQDSEQSVLGMFSPGTASGDPSVVSRKGHPFKMLSTNPMGPNRPVLKVAGPLPMSAASAAPPASRTKAKKSKRKAKAKRSMADTIAVSIAQPATDRSMSPKRSNSDTRAYDKMRKGDLRKHLFEDHRIDLMSVLDCYVGYKGSVDCARNPQERSTTVYKAATGEVVKAPPRCALGLVDRVIHADGKLRAVGWKLHRGGWLIATVCHRTDLALCPDLETVPDNRGHLAHFVLEIIKTQDRAAEWSKVEAGLPGAKYTTLEDMHAVEYLYHNVVLTVGCFFVKYGTTVGLELDERTGKGRLVDS